VELISIVGTMTEMKIVEPIHMLLAEVQQLNMIDNEQQNELLELVAMKDPNSPSDPFEFMNSPKSNSSRLPSYSASVAGMQKPGRSTVRLGPPPQRKSVAAPITPEVVNQLLDVENPASEEVFLQTLRTIDRPKAVRELLSALDLSNIGISIQSDRRAVLENAPYHVLSALLTTCLAVCEEGKQYGLLCTVMKLTINIYQQKQSSCAELQSGADRSGRVATAEVPLLRRSRLHSVWHHREYWTQLFHSEVAEDAKKMKAAEFKEQKDMIMFRRTSFVVQLMLSFHVQKSKVIAFVTHILEMRLFAEDFEPLVQDLIPMVEEASLAV